MRSRIQRGDVENGDRKKSVHSASQKAACTQRHRTKWRTKSVFYAKVQALLEVLASSFFGVCVCVCLLQMERNRNEPFKQQVACSETYVIVSVCCICMEAAKCPDGTVFRMRRRKTMAKQIESDAKRLSLSLSLCLVYFVWSKAENATESWHRKSGITSKRRDKMLSNSHFSQFVCINLCTLFSSRSLFMCCFV